jgi:hypothetical protein
MAAQNGKATSRLQTRRFFSSSVGTAALITITCLDNHEGSRGPLRIDSLSIVIAGDPVILVAIDAFAMKHRSPIIALQQLFYDTTSALLANFRHKKFLCDRSPQVSRK